MVSHTSQGLIRDGADNNGGDDDDYDKDDDYAHNIRRILIFTICVLIISVFSVYRSC